MAFRTLQDQFRDPGDEYTPIPFWFWNDALTAEEIVRQIGDFAEKGVMGFVIHPRMGLPKSIPYLSEPYMDLVEIAVKEADARGMQVILYDEAMYPSGSAQGKVVEGNPEYASRGLKMAEFGCSGPIRLDGGYGRPGEDGGSAVLGPGDRLVSAQAVRLQSDRRMYPGTRPVLLQPIDGYVTFVPPDEEDWSIMLFIETRSRGTIRGVHFGEDDGEPDAPPAADLLNPLATAKFIRLTHERYYERVGAYFGRTIRAMFTDEPDMLGRRHIKGLHVWTEHFLGDLIRSGCEETDLALLWLETADSPADAERVRSRYRKAVHDRLSASYYRPLSEWCARHGIAFTGHPAASDGIGLQEHFHIPGQDVVWRWVGPEGGTAIEGRHSTAGKCSSDAARHRGRRRNLNEFLGVCSPGGGWALSGSDMKWYIDWLAVRGVNLFCPHAFYYSIAGDRRNERPPDVGPNNIWWPHYRLFADYMKRMSWLMTDSVNVTPIAVLCREDWMPWRITKPLYQNQLEFNYLEESLLTGTAQVKDGEMIIQAQRYRVVLVEDEGRFGAETGAVLARFMQQGGRVVRLAAEGDDGAWLGATAIREPDEVVAELDRLTGRDVTLSPACPHIRVSHLIKEGSHFYLFVHEGEEPYSGTVRVKAAGRAERWEAWEGGSVFPVKYAPGEEGGMNVALTINRREAVILRIDPSAAPEYTFSAKFGDGEGTFVSLSSDWLAAVHEEEQPHSIRLGSWTEWEGMERFSGTVTYTRFFTADGTSPIRNARLDLGEVHELAEVWVNGQFAGVKMWKPYTFDIAAWLKQGDNEIRIRVTNSLANRYDGAGLPSGLIGPVTIGLA